MLKAFGTVVEAFDMSQADLCAKVSLCDALIVRSATKVTREVIEASKGRLKVVGRAGVGIDNVDLSAATEFGVLVVNAPTANTIAAAEHGIALLCALSRNVAQADASMKAGEWKRTKYVGTSLVDKTLAVIGFGKVGSEVARRAKGLGMKVVAYDPYAPAERVRAVGAELVSFADALATGDFFSLHMPLTSSTQNLFNAETFGKMKKGAFIINVARGGVIEDAALLAALENGTVKGAALDVFEVEPPAADHPLVRRPDVICTPHLGASTQEAQEAVAVEIAEAVVGALKGELSATSVNAPMVSQEVLAELAPYVTLTEKLGRLAVQLVAGSGGIKDVKVSYTSGRSDELDTRLLRAMVVKGLVEPVSDTIVNIVNADYVSKQRGLRIAEERLPSERDDVLSSVSVQLSHTDTRFSSARDEQGSIAVEGCVRNGVPYLIRVGSFMVDISLEGPVMLCRQVDQPGMIGSVGSILAADNVNISFMSVARKGPRTTAIMAIGVDEEPSAGALEAIAKVPAVEELCFLAG